MVRIFLKAFAIWFLFMILAVLNGTMREKLLVPMLGRGFALPLSGILLSAVIFLVTYALLPLLKPPRKSHYWLIGGLWLLLTLAFEFIFGHYVIGESWPNLLQAYNVLKGNLWALVLISIFVSPYLNAKIRRWN